MDVAQLKNVISLPLFIHFIHILSSYSKVFGMADFNFKHHCSFHKLKIVKIPSAERDDLDIYPVLKIYVHSTCVAAKIKNRFHAN